MTSTKIASSYVIAYGLINLKIIRSRLVLGSRYELSLASKILPSGVGNKAIIVIARRIQMRSIVNDTRGDKCANG